MGTCITTDGEYADGGRYTPPVLRGIEYWGWFGGSIDRTFKNHAPGKANGGQRLLPPVVFPTYVQFEGEVSALDTLVKETAALTFFCVGRAADTLENQDHSAYFVSNQADVSAVDPSRTSGGFSVWASAPGVMSVRSAAWSGTQVVTGSNSYTYTPDVWSYFDVSIEVLSNGGFRKIYRNKTQGIEQVIDSPAVREPNVRNLLFGDAASVNSGPVHMVMGALYSQGLTEAEKNLVYDDVKITCALREIAI